MTSDLPLTIPAVLERAVVLYPEVEALVDRAPTDGGADVRLTYPELFEAVDEAARALVASGVEAGDRVAIWGPNMAEWAITALAVHRCGGVVVPLNTRFKGSEAAYILRASGARRLFTVTDFLDTDYVALLDAADDRPDLDEVVVLRGPTRAGATTAWSDFLARAAEVEPTVTAARAAAIGPDDLSDILFTSGTTGAPKGAMLRHGASVAAYDAWSTVVGLREGDRWCLCASRFLQAADEGCPPMVSLASTHRRALEVVPLHVLEAYARNPSDG